MAFKNSTNQQVGKKMQDFDIQLNVFGELATSLKVEEINEFLNTTVVDKKINNEASVKKEKHCLEK